MANVTNLSLIPAIRAHFGESYVNKRAYELSTYGSTLDWLHRHFSEVITSEFFPDEPLGTIVGDILNQDVQHLTFEDESIDLVTSNQVFEHVPDDRKGLKECHRVLRRGGAMIMNVPLYDIPFTRQIATVVDSKIEFLGEPEYHDSRLGGAKSAPVFWRHSRFDISARVRAAGFNSVTLLDVVVSRNQVVPTNVVYAIK